MLLQSGDLLGPRTVRRIGVGDSGGVRAFGFGETVDQVVEALLQGGARHRQKRITLEDGSRAYNPEA